MKRKHPQKHYKKSKRQSTESYIPYIPAINLNPFKAVLPSIVVTPPQTRLPRNPNDKDPNTPIGGYVSVVADWVLPQHRTPFLLATSLYGQPLQSSEGWWIESMYTSPRVACWSKMGLFFIGCRGTNPFGPHFNLDLIDDAVIAGISTAGPEGILLVQEAEVILKDLIVRRNVVVQNIMVGGHSLGGYAAMMLGAKYLCKVCSFNGGAPCTNPVRTGPGPALATHYHIVGDLVSTHMDPVAAQVLRIDTGARGFGVTYSHDTERFLKTTPVKGFLTADEADTIWLSWGLMTAGKINTPVGPIQIVPSPFTILHELVLKSPIPGSQRALTGGSTALVTRDAIVYSLTSTPAFTAILEVGKQKIISGVLDAIQVIDRGIPQLTHIENIIMNRPPPNGYPGTLFVQDMEMTTLEGSMGGTLDEMATTISRFSSGLENQLGGYLERAGLQGETFTGLVENAFSKLQSTVSSLVDFFGVAAEREAMILDTGGLFSTISGVAETGISVGESVIEAVVSASNAVKAVEEAQALLASAVTETDLLLANEALASAEAVLAAQVSEAAAVLVGETGAALASETALIAASETSLAVFTEAVLELAPLILLCNIM